MLKLKRTYDSFSSPISDVSPSGNADEFLGFFSPSTTSPLIGSHNHHRPVSPSSTDMDFGSDDGTFDTNRPSKRRRHHQSGMTDSDEDDVDNVHGNNSTHTPQQQQQQQQQQHTVQQLQKLIKRNRSSQFSRPEDLGVESQSSLLERFVAYRKQRKNRTQQSSSSSSSCGTQTPSALPRKKVAFTEDEVKLLLSHREEQIRAEYDKILQERLQEQFNQFAQFNQDYISRQYKQTDFSYIY